MNKDDIKKILPHREPMLLIDEADLIISDDGSKKAVGKYFVKGDEWFLQGHFPGNPVVPGVILCEIMAQTCCTLFPELSQNKTPYFTGLNNVRFRGMVKPQDTVVMECNITRSKLPFYFASGKGYVNDKLVISADFSFAIMDQ